MGQRLDDFDFAPYVPAGRPPKYPWHEWADGSIWQIVRGVDYEIPTRSIQAAIFAHATRENTRARTRRVDVEGREGLVFCFLVGYERP